MKNKCSKYEALFVFGDEKSFKEHIETCPDCKAEHEKMLKVSALVKEAKPYFKKTGKKVALLQRVCASFLLFMMIGSAGVYQNYTQQQLMASGHYEKDVSVISEMGFPVDDYGLLLIE